MGVTRLVCIYGNSVLPGSLAVGVQPCIEFKVINLK
jgi:hypothetical protein